MECTVYNPQKGRLETLDVEVCRVASHGGRGVA